MIASIVGLPLLLACGVGVIGSVVGVVLGHISRRQVRLAAGLQEGGGMALAAIIIGWVGIGLFVAWFLFWFLAFALS